MARIKLLMVAAAVASLGAAFLIRVAHREIPGIEARAEKELAGAANALGARLQALQAAELAAAKQVAQGGEIVRALDDQGRPTASSLEAAVSAVAKLTGDAAKPDTVIVIAGGGAGRYRVGKTNRFDAKLDPELASKVGLSAAPGSGRGARTLFGALDGSPSAVAVAPLVRDDGNALGALVLGWSLTDDLARTLGQELGGLGVTFVAARKVTGSNLTPMSRPGLARAARAGADGFGFGPLDGEPFLLVAGLPESVTAKLKLPPLPLGGAELTASRGLALPLGDGALAVLSVRLERALAELAADQRMLLGGIAGLVFLCLLLMAFGGNPAKGLPRLAAIADKLAQGDLSVRAPTEGLASGVRRIAVALNAIAANAEQRAASPAAVQTASSPGAFAKAGPSVALDMSASPDALLQNAAQAFDPSQTVRDQRQSEQPAPQVAEPPRSRVTAEAAPLPSPKPAAGADDDFAGLFAAASTAQKPAPAAVRASPSQPQRTAAPPPPPKPAAYVPGPMEDDGDGYNPDATVIAQVPEALVRATRAAAPSSRPSQAPSSDAVELPAPREPSRVGGAPASQEDAHFQQVYKDFVQTREKCGEPADGLTFDKFAVKLRKNKEQLVQKYACKSVRFQVYVKEGKAALKATPVKD